MHLDSAERNEIGYDVEIALKSKDNDYVEQVRAAIVEKIKHWLGTALNDRITFAVAVEETEAWVLTIYDNSPETDWYTQPKERLNKVVSKQFSEKNRKQHFQKDLFNQYLDPSKPLRKQQDLNQFRRKNKSLDLFCSDIERLPVLNDHKKQPHN